jgi:aryl-alcohol dehydrogenase-like predicted oxidoreductase
MPFGKPLPEMSFYTFGTMSIGKGNDSIRPGIALAREAMDAGIWFHTCRGYASVNNYNVLGRAFREAPDRVPPCICKIRCYNADALRIDVEDTRSLLGKDCVEVAQLSARSGERKEIVDDFLAQGPMWQACCELREAGHVGSFLLELFVSCAEEGLRAVECDMFDGYGFYFSALAREVTNGLWAALAERDAPVVSICSIAGGNIMPAVAQRLAAERPDHYLLPRRAGLVPVFERSGCADWLEFSLAFLRAHPNVATTVGGTSSREHLHAFLETAARVQPLAADLAREIHALQDEWMAEF